MYQKALGEDLTLSYLVSDCSYNHLCLSERQEMQSLLPTTSQRKREYDYGAKRKMKFRKTCSKWQASSYLITEHKLSLKKILEGENKSVIPVLWFVFRVTMPYIHCNHIEIKPEHFFSYTQAGPHIYLVSYGIHNKQTSPSVKVHTTPKNLGTIGVLFSSGFHPSQ